MIIHVINTINTKHIKIVAYHGVGGRKGTGEEARHERDK